ncbi:TetR/AcrR family transcriptional regulator C-terminal domain-containing protein [Streptomyces marincola]|uniref:TetR/AcrR family transcriptional regulator C-terminal domain-containing protein n=1 Tax=Streptomyces marincola TaxID=2878388 RepID=UPI001CF3D543|nr:TetR/AcrR family transcriptional regulator C-terminal domain-containing protein [Streptomyces marincola]UCM89240.1 TetR/AcrR family transcriptional regulator C-terminal domain-containing protein [Streptomyces marincola]
MLARSEHVHSLLLRAGLDGARLTVAVGALTYFVQGYTAAENVWRVHRRDPQDEAELRAGAQQFIEQREDRYPTLAGHARLVDDDFDGSFLLGLETILDGIAAHAGGRGTGAAGRAAGLAEREDARGHEGAV